MIMNNKEVCNSYQKELYHCVFSNFHYYTRVCISILTFMNLQREGRRKITASYRGKWNLPCLTKVRTIHGTVQLFIDMRYNLGEITMVSLSFYRHDHSSSPLIELYKLVHWLRVCYDICCFCSELLQKNLVSAKLFFLHRSPPSELLQFANG